MKWRSEIDYHGYHAYGADERRGGRFALAMASIVNLAKQAVRKIETRPVPPTVLLHDGLHSFSLLGADVPAASSKDPACPFPLKAAPADRRDWRVLP